MKKIILAALLAVILPVSTVSAHVRLEPSTAVVGRQTYYVRVPNEKDIPTTEVRVIVPDEVDVTGILPTPGWSYKTKTVAVEHAEDEADASHGHGAAAERITEITWNKGRINAGEYMLFGIATNYQGEPGELVWKAYQTYSDGTVVPWDDSSEQAPAPKVVVSSETQLEKVQSAVEAIQQSEDEGFEPDANTWLAGLALILAAAGLGVALRKN